MKNYDTLASILDFLNKLEEAIRNYDDNFISKNRMFSVLNRDFSIVLDEGNSNRYYEEYTITSLCTKSQERWVKNIWLWELLTSLDPKLKELLSELYEEFNCIPVVYSEDPRFVTSNQIVSYKKKIISPSFIEKRTKIYEEYNLSLYTNEYWHFNVMEVRDPRSSFEIITNRRCTYLLKNQIINWCKVFSSDWKKFIILDPRGFKVALGEVESKKVEMVLLFTWRTLEELNVCWAFVNNWAKLFFPDIEPNLEFINMKFMDKEKKEQLKTIDYFLRFVLTGSTASLKWLSILGEK